MNISDEQLDEIIKRTKAQLKSAEDSARFINEDAFQDSINRFAALVHILETYRDMQKHVKQEGVDHFTPFSAPQPEPQPPTAEESSADRTMK
jgi:hypothetical protein